MIFISIGANLPLADGTPPIETCRHALTALSALPGLHFVAASGWWQTAPIPPSGQPPYINGVVGLDGYLDPEELLQRLRRIEQDFERVRTGVNAARTLDLDIIAVGTLIRASPDPILPHPRAHLRAFVLKPLHEIAPNWRHPKLNKTVLNLLADVVDQPCERVAKQTEAFIEI
jgi:2-amino-4-hydroxy-6-hydroxymethyldihydropteridine diphosphokinase